MQDNYIPLLNPKSTIPKAAIFLSGSGSNATEILKKYVATENKSMEIVCLITDLPETSKARELGEKFNIPVVENDIKKFYLDRGVTRVSLMTPEGRKLREEWTDILREKIANYNIDFGIFAGFIPLCNITGDFPCLNVHPGDLTYLKNGERYLIGLHTFPIERAILEGLSTLRSSVILAETYTDKGGEMDQGLIIGISDEVTMDFQGHSLEELTNCLSSRPASRPKGGYKDLLEDIANLNQDLLKEQGDWIVFPPSVNAFAEGKYYKKDSNYYYKDDNGEFIKIKTIVFSANGDKKIIVA